MADFVATLFKNVVLVTAATAWITAQVLKIATSYYKVRHFKPERLVGPGGMPSSHTSLVVGLAAAVGFESGLDSPTFAIATVLAGIVMYDAAGVRRAAGRQAKVINKLVQETLTEGNIHEIRLKEILGHTPLEVVAGAVLGIVMAYGFHRFY